jgi:NADH:ubiquinone oxidoreductase subunit 5 (subunit L)/multisubunit Na+/H+ antiporter MnhA subunit
MVWLPIAMSAPTPIRALVHSRTLVTAGLFMALKFSRFLLSKIFWLFGGLTMLVAGAVRLLEMDLKKVIALSTLRQLGLLGIGLGFGIFSLTLFHIMSHALIKRALFILVGVLLHTNFGSQDKRLIQVLRKRTRFCFRGLVFCSLALCGLGLTRGLVRKEAFLLQRRGFRGERSALLGFILVVSLTFIYCGRLLSVSLQPILPRRARKRGRRKALRRRGILLVLGIVRAWRLGDRFICVPPTNRA